MKVLITTDTEAYPLCRDWQADGLRRDLDRDIYGRTPRGECGLAFQAKMLADHGLKGCFFVEGLFASVVGREPLAEIVRIVADNGHEVQLHLHPEWLPWMTGHSIEAGPRYLINQFSLDDQRWMIQTARQNLLDAGAKDICAFRAGDFAANRDTLRALEECQIKFDSSHNPMYPAVSLPDVAGLGITTEYARVGGICEIPITAWGSSWNIRRHAQICSTSSLELEHALNRAYEDGREFFVIVSHSFELLKKRRARLENPAPDPIAIKRFSRLCGFLARNRDRFQTCGFAGVQGEHVNGVAQSKMIRIPFYPVAVRYVEQAIRRLS